MGRTACAEPQCLNKDALYFSRPSAPETLCLQWTNQIHFQVRTKPPTALLSHINPLPTLTPFKSETMWTFYYCTSSQIHAQNPKTQVALK